MRTLPIVALAALLLAGCGLSATPPTPRPAAKPAAKPAAAVTPWDATETAQRLNVLVNDTNPGSADWTQRKADIARHCAGAVLPGDLRMAVNEAAAFAPLRIATLRRELRTLEGQSPAAPGNLSGARVERRIGPALYAIRLPGGAQAFLSTDRNLKTGARLGDVPAVVKPRSASNASGTDLEDEGDGARTFIEATPATRRRRELEEERIAAEIRTELRRLDDLATSVNAVLGPRLLPRRTASAAFLVPRVGRMSRSWGRRQYYRYAVPVTGRPGVDATLKGYLDARLADMKNARAAAGKSRRARDTDIVSFKTFTAAPRILSIRFEELRDFGGAHPVQNFAAFTFDMASQTQLGLSDIFTDLPAALAVLSELAGRRIDLELGGAPFPEGYAPKAENFATFVLDGGVMEFTFPAGQVASRAAGAQTLRAPLSHPRLLPLLKPEFMTLLTAAPDQFRPPVAGAPHRRGRHGLRHRRP